MRQRLLLLILVPLCVALGAAQSAQSTAPFNDSIRIADLRADLFFLAGDGFKGRLVGTPENALAAEFVRSRFERAGLKPGAPDGSFVQATNLMVATLGSKQPARAGLGRRHAARTEAGAGLLPAALQRQRLGPRRR